MFWTVIRLALAFSTLALVADHAVAFPISRGGAHIAAKLKAGWSPIHLKGEPRAFCRRGQLYSPRVSADAERYPGALICLRVADTR